MPRSRLFQIWQHKTQGFFVAVRIEGGLMTGVTVPMVECPRLFSLPTLKYRPTECLSPRLDRPHYRLIEPFYHHWRARCECGEMEAD